MLKGKLGAEQTGPLRAGKEKEQFLEEGDEARGQLICEGMMVLLLWRLIMVTPGTAGQPAEMISTQSFLTEPSLQKPGVPQLGCDGGE